MKPCADNDDAAAVVQSFAQPCSILIGTQIMNRSRRAFHLKGARASARCQEQRFIGLDAPIIQKQALSVTVHLQHADAQSQIDFIVRVEGLRPNIEELAMSASRLQKNVL